jgi:hypothetical protein
MFDPRAPLQPRLRHALAGVALAAIVFVVYRGVFGVYFLNEDFTWLRVCRLLPGRDLWTLLSRDVMVGRYSWRPLVQASFALNYAAGGLDPFSYRLEVLFWHLLGAWGVYALATRLAGAASGLVAALTFALHPLQVESLAWTCARGGPMSTVFLLAAVLGYLHWRQGRVAAWVIVPFALALATQESSVVLIGLLAAGDLVLPGPTVSWPRRLRLYVSLLIVLIAAFAVHRWISPAQLGFTMAGLDPERPLGAGVVWGVLAKLQTAAAMLLTLNGGDVQPATILFLVLALLALWRRRRGSPLAAWGLLWIVFSLAPYTLLLFGPFPRYMHLPLVGFGLLAGDLVVAAAQWLGRQAAVLKPLSIATFLLLWCGHTTAAVGVEMRGYAERGRKTRDLVVELRQLLPQPRPGSTLGFYRVGELRVHDGVFIFGLEDAVRVIYNDDSLQVAFHALGDADGIDYHLVYLDGHLRRLDSPS